MMNSSEKVFYGGNTQFSYDGCRWIEKQSEILGYHIHHAMCGHGGERCVKINKGNFRESFFVDGYEPMSNTIFQYHGCKWHGCPCQSERTDLEKSRYTETIKMEKVFREDGFNVTSVWEHEKPELKKERIEKKSIPYPYFIVYDFEAYLKPLNEEQTEDLTIKSEHVPVSVAINDNLTCEPVFLIDKDPKNLIKRFVEVLLEKQEKIFEKVKELFPCPCELFKKKEEEEEEPVKLPEKVIKDWFSWSFQVPVFGFNSAKYDINMIKEYFVKTLADISTVNVAKKDNSYMFLSLPQLKFLDIKNTLPQE